MISNAVVTEDAAFLIGGKKTIILANILYAGLGLGP